MRIRRSWRNGGDAAVASRVSGADVHLAAIGNDDNGSSILRHMIFQHLVRRMRLLRFISIIVSDRIRQRGMRQIAIQAVGLKFIDGLKSSYGALRFRAIFAIDTIRGEIITQLHEQFLKSLYVSTGHSLFE